MAGFEEKTFDMVPNESLEESIFHWETVLSDSLQAVHVAQQTLANLYPQRYETGQVEVQHTGLTLKLLGMIDEKNIVN